MLCHIWQFTDFPCVADTKKPSTRSFFLVLPEVAYLVRLHSQVMLSALRKPFIVTPIWCRHLGQGTEVGVGCENQYSCIRQQSKKQQLIRQVFLTAQ